MILYSLCMFIVAILLLFAAAGIYRGNTHWIHDYHQTKVTDHKAYGKAFGKALFVVALAPLFAGIIGLFGETDWIVGISIAVFFVLFAVGICLICAVQKKFNNGIF